MNGAQDMGGMHGFGPVEPEPNEPAFHAPWEKRAFAITLAMARPGGWNLDMSRSARESLPPGEYLAKTYYEIWLAALEKMMIARGFVQNDEIEAGHALHPAKPLANTLTPDDVSKVLYRGAPTGRETPAPARFKIGDRVRTKNIHPQTHTRLPRYVRGQTGTVELIHGCHVFPDSHALGQGENPHWLYTVRFSGRDLWGPASDPTVSVSVDAWEPYLEGA